MKRVSTASPGSPRAPRSSRSPHAASRARLLDELTEELTALEADALRRHLASIDAVDGPCVRIDGREVVNWCSNDYLGLSMHPALRQAAAEAASTWGVGARASRLLAGSTRPHTELEAALAEWFGAEAAIVYPSGYQANLGTLGALLSSRDAVFVDRLAHASLFDAARATRATLRVFRHNDPGHAAELLARTSGARRRFIITEGLFSMDGDRAPLAELEAVASAHEAIVYVDDAHGAFALGRTGRGSPEAAGVSHDAFLYMGTLGKALGCQGGFMIGPRTLIDLLRNRARTFVYSTALAVPVAAAALAALRLLDAEPQPLERLRAQAARLRERLGSVPLPHGCAVPAVESHIQPVLVGGTREVLDLAERLWQRGIWAPAIRPPTVPDGTARLRLSVTALHTDWHIDALAEALHASL